MKTLILDENNIVLAASILRNGGLVAFPTETVYGLGANALNAEAVKKIFKAKNRPCDNPIIVHISKKEDVFEYAEKISEAALKLMDSFWPGPLTIILKKSNVIPMVTSGGLDTVALRLPDFLIARQLIEELGAPIAAPSANVSTKPSSTSANHVLSNLKGKIDAIIELKNSSCQSSKYESRDFLFDEKSKFRDTNSSCDENGVKTKCEFYCPVGIESTVISMCDKPIILRPGIITKEEIENVIGDIAGEVKISSAIFSIYLNQEKVISPGLKYKHYAPNTELTVIESNSEKFSEFIKTIKNKKEIAVICFDEDLISLSSEEKYNIKFISYGSKENPAQQCFKLYDAFFELDKLKVLKGFIHICKGDDNKIKNDEQFNIENNNENKIKESKQLAVLNRLLKAASFKILKL